MAEKRYTQALVLHLKRSKKVIGSFRPVISDRPMESVLCVMLVFVVV